MSHACVLLSSPLPVAISAGMATLPDIYVMEETITLTFMCLRQDPPVFLILSFIFKLQYPLQSKLEYPFLSKVSPQASVFLILTVSQCCSLQYLFLFLLQCLPHCELPFASYYCTYSSPNPGLSSHSGCTHVRMPHPSYFICPPCLILSCLLRHLSSMSNCAKLPTVRPFDLLRADVYLLLAGFSRSTVL